MGGSLLPTPRAGSSSAGMLASGAREDSSAARRAAAAAAGIAGWSSRSCCIACMAECAADLPGPAAAAGGGGCVLLVSVGWLLPLLGLWLLTKPPSVTAGRHSTTQHASGILQLAWLCQSRSNLACACARGLSNTPANCICLYFFCGPSGPCLRRFLFLPGEPDMSPGMHSRTRNRKQISPEKTLLEMHVQAISKTQGHQQLAQAGCVGQHAAVPSHLTPGCAVGGQVASGRAEGRAAAAGQHLQGTT